jgi:glutaredoxin-related protein
MNWQTIMINKDLTKNEVKRILSTIFSVDTQKIEIYKNYELVADKNESILIFCVSSIAQTDYFLRLEIYIDESININDDFKLIKEFCKLANCNILFDDGTNNPYTWLLVHSSGETENISIDIDSYDNAEEYDLKTS